MRSRREIPFARPDLLHPASPPHELSNDPSQSSSLCDPWGGSLRYMAPEMWNDEVYSHKVDVFSFAILAYELLSRKRAYDDNFMTMEGVARAVCYSVRHCCGEPRRNRSPLCPCPCPCPPIPAGTACSFLSLRSIATAYRSRHAPRLYSSRRAARLCVAQNLRPSIPRRWPAALSSLISRCWAGNVAERPEFDEIVRIFDELEVMLLMGGNMRMHICVCVHVLAMGHTRPYHARAQHVHAHDTWHTCHMHNIQVKCACTDIHVLRSYKLLYMHMLYICVLVVACMYTVFVRGLCMRNLPQF